MNKPLKVVNVYYQKKEPTMIPYQSGLILDLEDGTFVSHYQDGFIIPFDPIEKEILAEPETSDDAHQGRMEQS